MQTLGAQRAVDQRFVMIPRSAWDEAIARYNNDPMELQQLQAPDLRESAARLASLANDPFTTGIFSEADCTESGDFTEDDILIVADDALIDPNSQRVYATQYFIAPVGLRGNSSWLLRDLFLAIEAPATMSGGARCCGPDLIGEQVSPAGGTIAPDCTPTNNSYCAWNAQIRPLGALNHDAMRTGAGRPVVEMRMFSLGGREMRLSFAGPLGGLAPGLECDNVVPICVSDARSGG